MIPRRITNEEILQRRFAGGPILDSYIYPEPAARREARQARLRALRVVLAAALSALAFAALAALLLSWVKP
jgi:hypothetical protein